MKHSEVLLRKGEILRIKEEYGVDIKIKQLYLELPPQFLLIPDKSFIKEFRKAGMWRFLFCASLTFFYSVFGLVISLFLFMMSPFYIAFSYFDKRAKRRGK